MGKLHRPVPASDGFYNHLPWKMQTSATGYKRKEKLVYAYVAQMVRAVGSYPTGQWFDSTRRYHDL